MADEGNIQHPIDSVKRKRSRHWDLEEAKKLVNRWSEEAPLEEGFLLNEKQEIKKNSLDKYNCMKRS